jgi:hypothetical protein
MSRNLPYCSRDRISFKTYPNAQSTARHAIHLQFDISANAHEIRAVQSQ